jgi:hypothetical protein
MQSFRQLTGNNTWLIKCFLTRFRILRPLISEIFTLNDDTFFIKWKFCSYDNWCVIIYKPFLKRSFYCLRWPKCQKFDQSSAIRRYIILSNKISLWKYILLSDCKKTWVQWRIQKVFSGSAEGGCGTVRNFFQGRCGMRKQPFIIVKSESFCSKGVRPHPPHSPWIRPCLSLLIDYVSDIEVI